MSYPYHFEDSPKFKKLSSTKQNMAQPSLFIHTMVPIRTFIHIVGTTFFCKEVVQPYFLFYLHSEPIAPCLHTQW